MLVNVDHLVVGSSALAPHLLSRAPAPKRLRRGAPEQIPAILLAKLALDSSVHNQALGAELLVVARRVGGQGTGHRVAVSGTGMIAPRSGPEPETD